MEEPSKKSIRGKHGYSDVQAYIHMHIYIPMYLHLICIKHLHFYMHTIKGEKRWFHSEVASQFGSTSAHIPETIRHLRFKVATVNQCATYKWHSNLLVELKINFVLKWKIV